MTEASILLAMKQMLYYTMMAVCIISVPMLIVGVFFSVIQSATQINEMTITFIPKMLVMFGLLFVLGPWMMQHLIDLTQYLMANLPRYLA